MFTSVKYEQISFFFHTTIYCWISCEKVDDIFHKKALFILHSHASFFDKFCVWQSFYFLFYVYLSTHTMDPFISFSFFLSNNFSTSFLWKWTHIQAVVERSYYNEIKINIFSIRFFEIDWMQNNAKWWEREHWLNSRWINTVAEGRHQIVRHMFTYLIFWHIGYCVTCYVPTSHICAEILISQRISIKPVGKAVWQFIFINFHCSS